VAPPAYVPLFLHIPKCAGKTLAGLVYQQYSDNELGVTADGDLHEGIYYYPLGIFKGLPPNVPRHVASALSHHRVRAVVGHFTYGLHDLLAQPSTYLTLLRHPLERVASLYYHLQLWGPHGVALGDAGRVFDRETTIEDLLTGFRLRELDNDQVRRISGLEPDFGRCTSSMLDVAKEHLQGFSVVGTTERFLDTVRAAELRLGWSHHTDYRHGNVNVDRPPAAALPARVRELILAHNQADVELYAYANELLDQQLGAADADAAPPTRPEPQAAAGGTRAAREVAP
jgi:hypothetical protein